MQKNVSVSLCMIVKDEERYIGKCLESVKGIADEIIVVDTGSSDKTAEIAREHGAKVYSFPWNGSFSEARNASLLYATGDWILLMDADEEFVQDDRGLFFDYIRNSNAHGCHFSVQNYLGKSVGRQYSLHNAFRLLRNNGLYEFKGNIHEQIRRKDGKSIEPGTFDVQKIRLYHYGYLNNVIKEKDKRRRNLPLLLEELRKDPENPFLMFNLGNDYMASLEYEKAAEQYENAYRRIDLSQSYAPHLIYRRALLFQMRRQYANSVKAASEGLLIYPICTDLEYLRGLSYFEWGKYTLAIQSLEKCLQMGDAPSSFKFVEGCGSTRPLTTLGGLYFSLGDYEKALNCYKKALEHDKTLIELLYQIGHTLNKTSFDQTSIVRTLSGFFADANYIPNQLVLADILINEMLLDDADVSLSKIEGSGEYPSDYAFLKAKWLFFSKEYQKSHAFFQSIQENDGKAPCILKSIREESASYLFLLYLLGVSSESFDAAEWAFNLNDENLRPLYLQILSLSGETEAVSLSSDDGNSEAILTEFSKLLDKLLKVREFDLFERLLPVLNDIDSKSVLISLAALYRANGYHALAAKTVLRSIRELDYIDAIGADILAQSIKN